MFRITNQPWSMVIGPIPIMRRTIFHRLPATSPRGVLATGIAFAAAVAVRHAFWGNCDWGRGNINVATNRSVNISNINRGKWEHNPDHRQGVRYSNADVRQKFAKTDIQAGKVAREDFRGKDGQKVLEPDRARPGRAIVTDPVLVSVTARAQAIVTGRL